jgi:two-component system NarL family response regulator
MPDTKHLSHLKEIKTRFTNTKVVIFTMHESSSYFIEAKAMGVDSYLLKTESITFIPTVLIKAMKGEFYCSDEFQSYKTENNTKPKIKPIEIKILKYLAKGLHYSDIALKIQKSEKTVEYHIYKLRKKFSVSSNVELLLKLSQDMIIQEE